jgi:type IV secretion system protein VirD4
VFDFWPDFIGTIKSSNVAPLIAAGGLMLLVIGGLAMLSHHYTLSGIKARTVGDGQHGTARWATKKEIQQIYSHVPFNVKAWRKGDNRPEAQGLVLGCTGKKNEVTAIVDSDDIHCLMIGASGVGKTAFFLYPNLEYACASGMSFLALDTKGDLARNYGTIAKENYGYNISVIDLRNPTRSDGNNLLTLINRYMDIAREHPENLAARAKAEKYAKILAKTIVNPGGEEGNYGQNAFFYDAAEGLLTSVILLLSEYLPPTTEDPVERRHIVSVFKLVQDLLEPSKVKGKSLFQVLMSKLPSDHKARWFAGAALNSAEQAMASVMSTVLSRLNAFLDSELEQVLCFDSAIDAGKFAAEKSAIFLILPEEDTTKNFMAGLMIQNLARELFAVADENGGKLKNRVVFFCDELGTMPPFDILPLFSAGRSRRLTLVPIIQSLAQLEKNYGKEGCEIIQDNCQDTIFGGFAPNSQTAEVLSKALGSRTVLSGSVSRGKNDPSQSLQMMERALMTPDELKSIPKGTFVVMKTGTHPMKTRLRLFLEWGITFGKPYAVPERANRQVKYANREDLERNILAKHPAKQEQNGHSASEGAGSYGGMASHTQSTVKSEKHRQIKT